MISNENGPKHDFSEGRAAILPKSAGMTEHLIKMKKLERSENCPDLHVFDMGGIPIVSPLFARNGSALRTVVFSFSICVLFAACGPRRADEGGLSCVRVPLSFTGGTNSSPSAVAVLSCF